MASLDEMKKSMIDDDVLRSGKPSKRKLGLGTIVPIVVIGLVLLLIVVIVVIVVGLRRSSSQVILGEPTDLPPTVDCHVHLWDSPPKLDLYPFNGGKGTVEQWLADAWPNGINRAVLVSPGFVGFNETYTLEVISRFPDRMRGAVSVDFLKPESVTFENLKRLHNGGIRAIKYKLSSQQNYLDFLAQFNSSALGFVSNFMLQHHWHYVMQITIEVNDLWPPVMDRLLATGVPIMVDHYGRPNIKLGLNDPGTQSILKAAPTGRVYVKLSAPFRVEEVRSQQRDKAIQELVDVLLKELGEDKLVFGTDWPYLALYNNPQNPPPTYEELIEDFYELVKDPKLRNKILGENAIKLYFT